MVTIRTARFNIHKSYVLSTQCIYQGADKSLARPGRKQARKHVSDARAFNTIETRAVTNFFFLQRKAPKQIHANLTETLACSLLGRAKDLSAPLYVFRVDLRTNSYYFSIHHSPIGLYNRDGVCLLRGMDWVFMCFVWIWEQTAIISLYSINWLVCITETECVYCMVRTGSLCVLCVSQNKPIISLYSINWLVCITETECVYCAVRTGV
jgi:hypothetical protein